MIKKHTPKQELSKSENNLEGWRIRLGQTSRLCVAGTAAKVTSSLQQREKPPLLPCSLSQPHLNLGGHQLERTSHRTTLGFRLEKAHPKAKPWPHGWTSGGLLVGGKREIRSPFRFHSGKQDTQKDGLSKRSFAYWAGKKDHYLSCTS